MWSLDECHFQQQGTRTRMWVPPEIKDPVLLHAPTRKSVACFGAVNVRTGTFIRAISPKFDARTFEAFLKTLVRHRARDRRMVVVLDNARYHHASLLPPCDVNTGECSPSCSSLRIRRTSPRSNGWGSSPDAWPPTTGISPP